MRENSSTVRFVIIIIIGFTSIIAHILFAQKNLITSLFSKSFKIQFRAILLCLHLCLIMPKKGHLFALKPFINTQVGRGRPSEENRCLCRIFK